MGRLGSKLTVLLALLVVLGISFTGAASAAKVVVAASGEPTTLDPHKTFNGYSFLITNQVYETLVTKNSEGFQPKLATKWEMVDDTTWRFWLRKGVKFTNGDDFNAESVQYSVMRLIDPATAATGAFVLSTVKEVKVVDDYTVDIVTKAPFAPLLAHLTHPVTAIVNKNAVEKYGEDIGRNPVGTGPFVFTGWNTGNELTLTANPNYWGGKPAVDTLVVRVIPEVSTQLVELQSGTVDMMFHVPPDKIASLQRNKKIELFKELGWGSNYVGFNTQEGPTADVRVRQAIAHAIDRDSIVEQLRRGMAVKATAPIPESVWGANTKLAPYEYNVELAKKLLAEAGYADGFSIDLLVYQNEELEQLAQAIQYLLDKVNITVNVQVMDYGAYVGKTTEADHGMFLSGWGTVTLDADYTLYALFHSSEIPENNTSFFSSARVDELLAEARRVADHKARQAAYDEAQEIINAELPLLTVYYPLFSYAKNERIQGERLFYSWINLDLSDATVVK